MTTVAFYDTKPYDRQYFQSAAHFTELQVVFHEFHLSSHTAEAANGAQAVCVFVNDLLDATCLQKLHALGVRMVACRCAGFNNVDLTTASSLGIAVVRVPAYSPHAVAEYAVALLLALNRKIHRAYNRVREHNLLGFDLHGKTVGIVGTGRIGKIAAQIFRGFGTQVLASDPYPSLEWAATNSVRYAGIESLLAQSDIVSLHLPLTPESLYLLNTETFARMKPGAYLVNTSRGKLVATKPLIQVLKSGKLAGVALDVYEEEENLFFEDHSGDVLQDDDFTRLLSFPNVLITAHQAFFTHEALTEIARVTTENLVRFSKRKPFQEGTAL